MAQDARTHRCTASPSKSRCKREHSIVDECASCRRDIFEPASLREEKGAGCIGGKLLIQVWRYGNDEDPFGRVRSFKEIDDSYPSIDRDAAPKMSAAHNKKRFMMLRLVRRTLLK